MTTPEAVEFRGVLVAFIRWVFTRGAGPAPERAVDVPTTLAELAALAEGRGQEATARRLLFAARNARRPDVTWREVDDVTSDDPSPQDIGWLVDGGWGLPDERGRVVDPTSGEWWSWRRAVAHERRAAGHVEAGEARCAR